MSVLVVDKPVGPTSYDVVRRVQRAMARLWNVRRPRDLKVGHGGTLDPLASGVLPVCIGEATKLAPFLLAADKEYEAVVRFGIETDTLDAAGTVVAEASTLGLDGARVAAALGQFRGPITQVPPMHSALKHQGRALYTYARQGEEIARAPRSLTIFELELLAWEAPATVRLRVRCSKGTYVRVLAADLGRVLGTGAHLAGLRRTASGPFDLTSAQTIDQVERLAGQGVAPPLISLSDALVHLPALTPPAPLAAALWQGKKLSVGALGLAADFAGRLRVLRDDGTLLAVAEATEGVVRTLRGFQPEDRGGAGAGAGSPPGAGPPSGSAGLASDSSGQSGEPV
jgi:tRNA pseudouridine55 synthase